MILAIDCGSTNHKVALFDEELRRLAGAAVPVAYAIRDAERVEFEPEMIWRETVRLIQRVCAAARIQPGRIRTVALASQAQTFTLLDAAGEPVTPFLSWADKRAADEASELAAKLGPRFHQHCSFPEAMPQLQIAKLLWWARRLPAAQRSRVRVASLPAFLALRLAGLHCTDTNLAAMSGAFSMAAGEWWTEAISLCGLEPGQCGTLVALGTRQSARARCAELSFGPELEIVFAGNDQTAGAYGNHAGAADIVLTLGTVLVAYRVAGRAAGPFHRGGCWGPYPGNLYYELFTRDEGCAALDWAVTQLAAGDEAEFFRMAEGAPCSGSYFFPQRMRTAGAWAGHADRAGQARAVLEGICFSLRELVAEMVQPEEQREVIVIGGGSASRFWLAMLANVLNRPVRRGRGDILLGAARLARPGVNPPETSAGPERFPPEPKAAEAYNAAFRAWQSQAALAGRQSPGTHPLKP